MNPYMEHVAENGGHYARSPSSPRPFVPQQMALLSASITGGLFSRRGVSREEIRGATRTSDLDGFAESEPTLRAATLVCGRQGEIQKKINDRGEAIKPGDIKFAIWETLHMHSTCVLASLNDHFAALSL
ncbi:hypothetical protein ALC57_03784 [Trachymyrmex cornetzi]|uniref:Uncharacterized protein n=1 Tax=Trachymyrmex cornetzi TaxID=471704 RepID=A0A195EET2_9HYME|nr:hypothetical protein ALC57_03784 [Trachymyrmex cornetzi]